jgi:hypothetical protein
VGQLLKLREALSIKTMVVVDERDADLLREIRDDGDSAAGDSDEDLEGEDSACAGGGHGTLGGGDDGAGGGGSRRQAVGSGGVVEKVRNRVRLATVDNFQGEESRVVILSLVRNQTFLLNLDLSLFVCMHAYMHACMHACSMHVRMYFHL